MFLVSNKLDLHVTWEDGEREVGGGRIRELQNKTAGF
jgi:hypothetical protein